MGQWQDGGWLQHGRAQMRGQQVGGRDRDRGWGIMPKAKGQTGVPARRVLREHTRRSEEHSRGGTDRYAGASVMQVRDAGVMQVRVQAQQEAWVRTQQQVTQGTAPLPAALPADPDTLPLRHRLSHALSRPSFFCSLPCFNSQPAPPRLRPVAPLL